METQTPASAPAKKKRNLVPILIVGGVIVVIIIAGVAWKLSSSSSSKSGVPPAKSAKALYKAWQAGNQAGAAKVATPAAVTSMFAIQSSEANGLVFGKCHKAGAAALPKVCVWNRPGGQLTMTITKQNGKLVVSSVDLGAAATTPDSTG
jgi:hypothetical protein